MKHERAPDLTPIHRAFEVIGELCRSDSDYEALDWLIERFAPELQLDDVDVEPT